MLFCIVMAIPLTILDSTLFDGLAEEIGPFDTTFSLLTFFPSIAVAARRLHDIDKSGWWQLLPFIPALFLGVGAGMSSVNAGGISAGIMGISGLITLGTLILVIVWFAKDGEKSDNRFGTSPKYGGQAQAFD